MALARGREALAVHDNELRLSEDPNGGFYYGWVERNGELTPVEVLPPAHLWRGDVRVEGWKPDASAWIVYINGHEFARLERPEDVAVALGIERPRTRGLLARVRALLNGR